MTPERWQEIKHLVNSALNEDSKARTKFLQQSCADDFALRIGAEALLSVTRRLPEQSLAPDQWQRIEQLFQAALELTPSKRPAFLQQACNGDEMLKHEVESLLVYQGAAGALIGGAIHEAAGLLPNDDKARFTPGTTLNKRYRILGLLGKGGMGEVYRADDLTLQQPVALKFLSERLSKDNAMLVRFRSEVAMAHRVTHPNVCRVHDIGEVITSTGTLQFLSMEYVDGEDLSSLLRRIGRLPSDKAIEIAQQLCDGLAAAHEAGVLHRDLKPANVMIDGKGRVRITDFGLAGFAEQIKGNEVFAGTPAYMSPEQFAGKEVTTKSDIYALGLVLYEIFTGKRVFEAGSLDELKRMHESTAPTTPSSWVKDIDPLVERVILRCLEKDPAKRLASAKQVADALPGGDPLAAALALGETPSPEMVAAAGQKTGMKPMYAVLCLLAIIAGLCVYAVINRKLNLVERVGLNDSPDVMINKARAIFAQLGYADMPTDRAYGLQYDDDYISYVENNVKIADREPLIATGQTPAINFWYRESPTELNAAVRANERGVRATDPPETVPGMRSLSLDPAGRLLRFGVVPPQVEKNVVAGAVPDWKVPFALAGLDFSQFTAAEPEWMPDPPGVSDARMAWTGVVPTVPTQPLRIEAAAYHGKLVSFQMIRSYQTTSRAATEPAKGQIVADFIGLLILLAIIFVCGWLVRRNLQNGRADLRGAFRLSMAVFLFGMLGEILVVQHWSAFAGGNRFVTRIGLALFPSVMTAVIYLALEPFVRRKWPHISVSWNRLLAGSMRDPLVGRHVLVGLVLGVCLQVAFELSGIVAQTNGVIKPGYIVLETLTHVRIAGAITLASLPRVLLITFGNCAVIFLFRLVLKRNWLAFGSFVCLIVILSLLSTPPNAQLITLPIGFVFASMLVLALARFGILTMIAMYSVMQLTGPVLITTNLSAWYASNGLLAAGVVLALALYAFHTALGGQKLFSGKLLEE
ncbi:MAG: protein kinase [Blastocatellia bacterium]|nr:protein kinase [Blastocatellia bacterium]